MTKFIKAAGEMTRSSPAAFYWLVCGFKLAFLIQQ